MRKVLSILLIVVMLVTTTNVVPLFQPVVRAETVTTADGIVFNKDTGTITDYVGYASTLNIPSSIEGVDVIIIGDSAFHSKTDLQIINFPYSIIKIERYAFYNCTGISSITIPYSVENIEPYSFERCLSLTEIIVDESNTVYKSVNGVLFDSEIKVMYQYPSGKINSMYNIPTTIEYIEKKSS